MNNSVAAMPSKAVLDQFYLEARARLLEVAAMLDTTRFIARAQDLYGYPHFVCDTSGSICEVVDAADPADPVMQEIAGHHLLVWIKGTEAHRDELCRRFHRAPKPMYFRPEFLSQIWTEFAALEGKPEDQIDPDAFLRFGYARLLDSRQPRYAAMARWGVTVTAEEMARLTSPADFDALIAKAINRRM